VHRALVFNSFSRSHHHSSSDGIKRIGSKTSSDGDTPSKEERSDERVFHVSSEEDGLEGVVETKVETSVNNDTNTRDNESSVETNETIRGEGLSVDINEAIELSGSSFLGGLVIIGQSSSSIVKRIDEGKRTSTSSTTRCQVSCEPFPVAISLLVITEHSLELIFEGKVQGLSGEVSDDVGQVSSPEGNESFISDNSGEAIRNSLVRLSETTSLDHFILILDQEFDSFNGGSSSL